MRPVRRWPEMVLVAANNRRPVYGSMTAFAKRDGLLTSATVLVPVLVPVPVLNMFSRVCLLRRTVAGEDPPPSG